MEKAYAQALHNAVAKGAKEADVAEALIKHLREAGRLKLLPRILRELRAKESSVVSVLEVASEKERAHAVSEAKAEGVDAQSVVINDSLIRGWRARSGSTLIDRSAKRALIDLYRRIAS